MGFGIQTREMPYIRDHATAARVHDDIKPLRTTGERPLGKRSQKHTTIRQEGGNYVVRFYNTDVLVYRPDGTVDVTYWDSQSTRAILHAVADVECASNRWLRCYDSQGTLGWFLMPKKLTFTLRRPDDGGYGWVCDEMEYPVKTVINNAAAKRVMQKIDPLVQYARSFIKLYTTPETREYTYWGADTHANSGYQYDLPKTVFETVDYIGVLENRALTSSNIGYMAEALEKACAEDNVHNALISLGRYTLNRKMFFNTKVHPVERELMDKLRTIMYSAYRHEVFSQYEVREGVRFGMGHKYLVGSI